MGTYNKINEERLSKLYPPFANKVRQLIINCNKKGFDILVCQGLRTVEEQDALFAQGRTRPGKIVTKARGLSSYHNYGLAIDAVPLTSMGKADWIDDDPNWAFMIAEGEKLGLEAGAKWRKFPDKPHFQLSGGLTIASLKILYKKGGLKTCWTEIEKQLKNQGKL